jgi:ADP-heptose:LPS heptosyltransferase
MLLQQYPDWIREKTTIWEAPLPESAAFFSLFSLFVSGDTGPMHLAMALNCPTLTIFVGSNIQQYGYHDGKRHFSLFWQGIPDDRRRVNQYIGALVKMAEEENPLPPSL